MSHSSLSLLRLLSVAVVPDLEVDGSRRAALGTAGGELVRSIFLKTERFETFEGSRRSAAEEDVSKQQGRQVVEPRGRGRSRDAGHFLFAKLPEARRTRTIGRDLLLTMSTRVGSLISCVLRGIVCQLIIGPSTRKASDWTLSVVSREGRYCVVEADTVTWQKINPLGMDPSRCPPGVFCRE